MISALLAVAGLHAALDEDAGVRRWLHLRTELADARERIAGLEADVAGLRHDADRLAGDRFAIERAIREELGLASPGQRIVRLRPRTLTSP